MAIAWLESIDISRDNAFTGLFEKTGMVRQLNDCDVYILSVKGYVWFAELEKCIGAVIGDACVKG